RTGSGPCLHRAGCLARLAAQPATGAFAEWPQSARSCASRVRGTEYSGRDPSLTADESAMGALTRRALLLLLLLPGLVVGQQQASEYELKAAFLYNFATYVDWPEESFSSPDAAFVFGVVGSVELATNLELIVQGRDIRE